uniref:DUF676 domain-containing protein n=1 Tax=Parascaris equorum TaxID=6256 RepID=A0A914RJW1_PAREQ
MCSGGSEDLAPYRNYLRLLLPNSNLKFLLSESNRLETWADFNQLADNLINEIFAYIELCSTPPSRISYVFFPFFPCLVNSTVDVYYSHAAVGISALMSRAASVVEAVELTTAVDIRSFINSVETRRSPTSDTFCWWDHTKTSMSLTTLL